ncbi:UNVERIFIED_CONTAM: hypothetical protein HDU68_009366 [Siphonaria sp. JEL0065]|nr:hypothetical protein HDU68_009366 [Siphonaria sp. JEL0065]
MDALGRVILRSKHTVWIVACSIESITTSNSPKPDVDVMPHVPGSNKWGDMDDDEMDFNELPVFEFSTPFYAS